MADNCINGRWEDSICVCKTGYDVGSFNDRNLDPKYCEKEIVAVIDFTNAWLLSGVFFHFIAITVTVIVLTWSILGVCSVFLTILALYRIEKNTERLENEYKEFKIKKNKYEDIKMMNAALWNPPEKVFKQLGND